MENNTRRQVTILVFSGLTDNKELIPFLFVLFLCIYVVTIVGNIGIIALVYNTSRLHSPMYYFLSFLSFVDVFYSSVITPKMFSDLISEKKSSMQTICAFSLQFCGSNLIDHFYCDIPPLLTLSCSDTFHCTMVTIFMVGLCTITSLLSILLSYLLIFASVLRMRSSESRKKAFSTCSSHLMCASVFYVTVFFTYLRPPSSVFTSQDKVAAIFYAVVTPMLNPLAYTLRNQEWILSIIVLKNGFQIFLGNSSNLLLWEICYKEILCLYSTIVNEYYCQKNLRIVTWIVDSKEVKA
ncbi:unnamed protein product [Ranitomeya imitator]|uniref:G-protein coupled receptors family 1 profile domain-containing protein n=1 Tax=Ranitomeya imitator TaxID=111125 RepID=A0ABN9LFT5_9NEOB|nr:unnamed protein product [Ranitomeya imitator]